MVALRACVWRSRNFYRGALISRLVLRSLAHIFHGVLFECHTVSLLLKCLKKFHKEGIIIYDLLLVRLIYLVILVEKLLYRLDLMQKNPIRNSLLNIFGIGVGVGAKI